MGEPLEVGHVVDEQTASATPSTTLVSNHSANRDGEEFHPVHDPRPTEQADASYPKRVAIFGGTFDPIHIGHLILAEEAHFQLALDQVFLVPAGDPPHKQTRQLTTTHHRFAMCELATADIDYIAISHVDADRPGPHYTADMVRLMRQSVGPYTQLFFLMGMDSLRDLPTWREAAWLVENCTLVALSRHDVTLDWGELEAALPGLKERVIILDMPELEIASHQIQRRVKLGQPIRHQVPRLVEGYIHKHKLYL
jgi:nicotinate-nucleotide adenylyltransferase